MYIDQLKGLKQTSPQLVTSFLLLNLESFSIGPQIYKGQGRSPLLKTSISHPQPRPYAPSLSLQLPLYCFIYFSTSSLSPYVIRRKARAACGDAVDRRQRAQMMGCMELCITFLCALYASVSTSGPFTYLSRPFGD